jgi:hypothetical protein
LAFFMHSVFAREGDRFAIAFVLSGAANVKTDVRNPLQCYLKASLSLQSHMRCPSSPHATAAPGLCWVRTTPAHAPCWETQKGTRKSKSRQIVWEEVEQKSMRPPKSYDISAVESRQEREPTLGVRHTNCPIYLIELHARRLIGLHGLAAIVARRRRRREQSSGGNGSRSGQRRGRHDVGATSSRTGTGSRSMRSSVACSSSSFVVLIAGAATAVIAVTALPLLSMLRLCKAVAASSSSSSATATAAGQSLAEAERRRRGQVQRG